MRQKLLALAALSGVSGSALALDGAADIATVISGHTAGLALIGAAILGVVYAVRAFSWAKKI